MSLIGKTVRGYRITEFLGAGGMGEVYKAHHQTLGRVAAVKVLFQKEQFARFQNEAYIQSSVKHTNIAALYEFTSLDDKPCIIMEFVPGITLDVYLAKKGKLSNEEATQIFRQAIDAIAYLHQLQIVHRDIKPSNIKLMPDGTVKLLDFGIAKAAYSPKLTQQGFVIGTTEFMAPEQFRHQPELKSDIWALGILLYNLTTGFLPFEDSNPFALRTKIEESNYTNPRILNATLPKTLYDIISQCLKHAPNKRPTAKELLNVLSPQAQQKQTITQIGGQILKQASWRKWALAGGGVVLLLLTIWFSKPTPTPPEAPKEVIVVKVSNTNQAEMILPSGQVVKGGQFVIERQVNKPYTFTLREGEYIKSFTIQADYHDSTFNCSMDF